MGRFIGLPVGPLTGGPDVACRFLEIMPLRMSVA